MIYETLLGDAFLRLHPKLQHRYRSDRTFYASGKMRVIRVGPNLLRPFYRIFTANQFLFSEQGDHVPFVIANSYECVNENEVHVLLERRFYFPNATRTFFTTMKVDLAKSSAKDYLGNPALVNSDVVMDVTKEGFLLFRSVDLRAVLGPLELPLPTWITGRGNVLETYDDDKEVYTIHVTFTHPLLGPMMLYAGEFVEVDRS